MNSLLRENGLSLTLGGFCLLLSCWLYVEQAPTAGPMPAPAPTTATAVSLASDTEQGLRDITNEPPRYGVSDQPSGIARTSLHADGDRTKLAATRRANAHAIHSKKILVSSSKIPQHKNAVQTGSRSIQQRIADFLISSTDWRAPRDGR
jgi:hypothetical protein